MARATGGLRIGNFYSTCSCLISIVANLSFSALIPLTVQAQAADPAKKPDALTVYRESGIDRKQEKEIQKLVDDYDVSSNKRAKELVGLYRGLKKLSLEPDLDAKKILSTQEEINRLHAEIANDKVKLLINIRAVLTQEQKHRLVAIMQRAQKLQEKSQNE